ncbi:MAG: glycosyltransferase [Erysipelotrichales bacterium]|nr:glycosyltransferase [Erysipelotrichales bacterium]
MIKFTIVIPVYNVMIFLQDCFDSITNQIFSNYEVIIIDDGSTDGSGKFCDLYATKNNRMRVIHTTNRGVSAARNKGISEAKGEYIFFLDSDDYLDVSALAVLEKNLKDKTLDILLAKHYCVTEDKYQVTIPNYMYDESMNTSCISGAEFISYMLKNINLSYAWSCWKNVYKKDFLLSNNLYFNENQIVAEDTDFLLRLFLENPLLGLCNERVIYYRSRYNSVVHINDIEKLVSHLEFCKKWIIDLSNNVYENMDSSTNNLLSNHFKFLIVAMIPTIQNTNKNITKEYSKKIAEFLYLTNNSNRGDVNIIKFFTKFVGLNNASYVISKVMKLRRMFKRK